MFPTKTELPELHKVRRCLWEIAVGTVLGSLPVWIYSQSPQALEMVISSLLTAGPVLEYYLALAVVSLSLRYLIQCPWRSAPKRQRWLLILCRFLEDVSPAFLSAFRTAAGALIGFVVTYCLAKPEIFQLAPVLMTLGSAVVLIGISATFAWADEKLKDLNSKSEQLGSIGL